MSFTSIPEMILAGAEKHPYRPAFWLRGEGKVNQLNHRDLAARMLKIAAGLRELGVKPGTRVAIYADNSPEWCLAYLSTLAAGGVVVPLDRQLKLLELRGIITRAKVEYLFCLESMRSELSELAAMTAPHPQLVSLDADHGDMPTLARLERIGEEHEFVPHAPAQSDEMAILLFTSGTAGDSKGVMLSQRNILADLEAVRPQLPVYPEDRFLSLLPLHHTFESTAGFLYPLFCGASIVHATSLKSAAIAADIKEFSISLMCGVPLLFEKMYLRMKKRLAEASAMNRAYINAGRALGRWARSIGIELTKPLLRPVHRKAGLDSLRILVSGGAALTPGINRFFNDLGITLVQGYGLTETSPVVAVNPLRANVVESVGTPLPGVNVRIAEANPDGIGEICIKSEIVMLGYFENEEATRAALREGWFYTGDLGFLDDRGYLHVTGRKKNVIVTAAGKNIYPEEIETLLDNSPYILESAVLPRRRGSGEEPVAVVVADEEIIESELGEQSETEIEKLLREEVNKVSQSLADFKRIKEVIISREPLPKTSTRKIKKHLVLDKFRKQGVL